MRYFFIAGEPSGDLHAAHLIRAIKQHDPHAEFRGWGGDLMKAEGMILLQHYRELAYMGIVQVALHLPAILRSMKRCKAAIAAWKPDVVVPVDYPGFNLNIAKWVKQQAICPIFYYISPKIWAWKEGRIKAIRRDVDQMISILPFEVEYFARKHHYPIFYAGNPSLDEVEAFRKTYSEERTTFCQRHGLPPEKKIVALLPGSRRSEITSNLPRMVATVNLLQQTDLLCVVATAPGIEDDMYKTITPNNTIRLVKNETYALLTHATAAMVTSGTATLETALLGCPQVVCYHLRGGSCVRRLRPLVLKCPYISLVNLIAGHEVVPELIADHTRPKYMIHYLRPLLTDSPERDNQIRGYAQMRHRLGNVGAPEHAALHIIQKLEGTS